MTDTEGPGHDFEKLLEESVRTHRHLCPGQVLGVRMSMLGLKMIGIQDPKGKNRKDIIVFVEIDRCATDAIQSVTGCTAGKRSLKLVDYGKMAATFVNLKTGKAWRILALEESKDRAKHYFPEMENKYECQTEAYKVMPDEELFRCKEVHVAIPEEDMPGRPVRRVRCEQCGEHIQDRRDVEVDGRTLCKSCAYGGYYNREARKRGSS
jgi:formylmethanofuran dehydrogenase subunit E